jgi:hypothetical protein
MSSQKYNQILNENISQTLPLSVLFLGIKFGKNLGFSRI